MAEQELEHGSATGSGGKEERRFAFEAEAVGLSRKTPLDIGIGVVIEKETRGRQIAAVGRDVQRSKPGSPIAGVGGVASLEQAGKGGKIILSGGAVKREIHGGIIATACGQKVSGAQR